MMNKQKNSQIMPLVKELLQRLDSRSRDILERRYGLHSGEPQTLAKIGDQYHITRERVRQIEALALEAVSREIEKGSLAEFVQTALTELKNAGGVCRSDSLVEGLQKTFKDSGAPSLVANTAHFILEASHKLFYHGEDDEWYPHWHLSKTDQKVAQAFVAKAYDLVKRNKESILGEKKFETMLGGFVKAERLSPTVAMGYLLISKKFAKNHFDDFGLSEWPEIRPKTARDWAYLVLKREQKPLHFEEIAAKIGEYRTNKETNFQTVHNELIKDQRFVLVGRGMYGLEEFHILPGTAREVIAHFLKKHGPLAFSDLKKVILRERDFKENTILINLQNKDFFKKLEDGRYALVEA